MIRHALHEVTQRQIINIVAARAPKGEGEANKKKDISRLVETQSSSKNFTIEKNVIQLEFSTGLIDVKS